MNNAIIALDNKELEDKGTSFLDGASNFLQYGIVSAGTSAGVGIWNTLKAGANMFGADLSMTDETDAIRSTFGNETANYYTENKVAADFVGVLASSVFFGAGAIKGLRALQASGKVMGGHAATLGLANGDIVLGSRQVTAYRAAIMNQTNYSWTNRALIGAMGKATTQNLAEAAVAEGAFLLANNQNALINPENLDYVDSSIEAIKSGWMFAAGGAAFGTIVDGFRIKGYAAKAFKELNETGNAQALRLITDQLKVRNGVGGDRLHETQTIKNLLDTDPNFALTPVAEGYDPLLTAMNKAKQQLTSLQNETIAAINKGDAGGVVAMQQILDIADEQGRLHILGNLQQVTSVGAKDLEDTLKYYTKQGLSQLDDPNLRARVQGSTLDEEAMATLHELNTVRIRGANAAYAALGRRLNSQKSSARLLNELAEYAKTDPEFAPKLEQLLSNMAAANGRYGKGELRIAQLEYTKNRGDQAVSILKTKIAPEYAEDLAGILTDVATKLSAGANGYALRKQFPVLGDIIDKTAAGTLRPFNSTKVWYNTRTKAVTSSALPRAQDLGRVRAIGDTITIDGLRVGWPYRQDAVGHEAYFASLKKFKNLEDVEHPSIQASAHWAAAAQRGIDKTDIALTDLPRLERYATAVAKEGDTSIPSTVTVRGKDGKARTMTQQEAADYVIEQKIISRTAMQAAGHSAEEIAVVLNTGEKFAMGHMADDVLLMATTDYTRAESVMLKYKPYSAEEVDIAARTVDGLAARVEIERGIRNLASASTANRLGATELYAQLPAEELGLLHSISQTDQRAGAITSAQSDFGTMRAWAANVGAMVNKAKDGLRLATTEQLHPFYEVFTKPENRALRAELSFFLNKTRTDDYHVLRIADGGEITHVAITRDAMNKQIKAMHDAVPDFDKMPIPQQRDVTMAIRAKAEADIANMAAVERMIAAKDPNVLALSKDVGELVEWHMKRNMDYIANDKAIANARGYHVTRDGSVFYPPPMNLRRTPYVAFVKPRASDSEAPSYMIYAASQADLDAKMAYVTKGWGKTHRIVTQTEISEYKAMKGEYDKNRVFDEVDFSPELRNMGKAGDALPSGDLYAVESLDLIRNWHHNKQENQLMSAIELKYQDTVSTLRNADKSVRGNPIDGKMERSTVYEDTVNMMLDKKSTGGSFQQLYGRVSDAFDNYGSRALDTVGGAMVDAWQRAKEAVGRGKPFDVTEFEALTAKLEAQGFVNPYTDIGTFIARSEVISDARTANALGRVLNTLVAGLTLRLDTLNSFVQLMSTPIMLAPVIREAMLAAPPQQRNLIARMTTVVNPANGVAEPTMMKILGKAIKDTFTGKDKLRAEEALRRGITQDYTRQFLEATDFSSLNGRHTLQQIQEKIDKITTLLSKATMHQRAEDFSRRMVMNAMMDIAEAAGLKGDAAWAMVRTGVDKVHGIYRANSRVQLFNGTIGQSIGLFQTYMFNMAQYMTRGMENGRTRDLAIMGAMQASLFGIRSLPAFGMLNNAVAQTNSGNMDIYTLAGSEHDPDGIASYFLYGLGSNLLVVPTDAFSRGDIALRHTTVLPLNPLDWPSIAMISKAYGNVVDSVKAFNEGASLSNAMAYGLAHNALNRPLQGLGTIWLGSVTSNKGTPLFNHSNYDDYSPEASFNWGALGARLLGGKPKAEAVALDSYYRRTAYQSGQREQVAELGKSLRIAAIGQDGIDEETYTEFFDKYTAAGGTPEGFNGFVGRNLVSAEEAAIPKFKDTLENTSMGRLYGSMMTSRRLTPVWEDDNAALSLGSTQP